MLNLKTFRKITNGFARGHHFNIGIIDWRDPKVTNSVTQKVLGAAMSPLLNAYCSATHLPAKTTDMHELRLQSGIAPIRIAKSVNFATWKVTFYADEMLALRFFFLRWMELINNTSNHTFSVPSAYKSSMAYAAILSPQDIPVHVYCFKGLFPINVSEIVVQQRDTDIMTFDVEFAYDFFKLNDPVTFGIAVAYELVGDTALNKIYSGSTTLKPRSLNAPLGLKVKIPF